MVGSSKGLFLGALLAGALGCDKKPAPRPDPPPPPASASAPASAAAKVPAAPARRTIPTFTLERFEPKGEKPTALFAVEGGLAVVEGHRVGRVAGDGIEWLGKIPSTSGEAYGPNRIRSVMGTLPDGLGALYVTSQDRALQPTYWPVTGKGKKLGTGAGGTRGEIVGIAKVGASTLVAWYTYTGTLTISTVRGPELSRKLTSEVEGGCKEGEVHNPDPSSKGVAVWPAGFAATAAGTLISVGDRCERHKEPVAEVWDKDGKSRIIPLGGLWKRSPIHPPMVPGKGDELFIHGGGWDRVIRYHDGQFEEVPPLAGPTEDIFGSPSGDLHAFDGKVIYKLDGKSWVALGRLAEPRTQKYYPILAADEGGNLWLSDEGVFRLRPAPGGDSDAPPDAEHCQTPFVYLYRVVSGTPNNFMFPVTRKALQSFPQAAAISLVDFTLGKYDRNLGVVVADRAQAEAVIAHVKATMKDEDPRLFCFAPPAGARKIELEGK